MKYSYIPVGTTSVNQVMDLNYSMTMITKAARSQSPVNLGWGMPCSVCEYGCSVEWHHTKPLWAKSIERVIDIHLETGCRFFNIALGIWDRRRQIDFSSWHSCLVPVCKNCHLKRQTIDDLATKVELLERYDKRIVFSITWADSWRNQRYKKNIPLEDYAVSYMNRQYESICKLLREAQGS